MPSFKDLVGVGEELVGYGATFHGATQRGDAQKMRDLLAHPDFNKLSKAGQIQYFGEIFPDFANLTPGEFQQVRNRAATSPLGKAGEEAATNLMAGELGGKLAGEALSAAAPVLGKAGGVLSDVGRSLVPKRFSEARAARAAKEALSKPKTFGASVPTERYAGSKYTTPPTPQGKAPPLRPNIPEKPAPPGRTPAPALRPNVPEKPAPKGMSPAPPLRPNVAKTAQEVGRTTTPAPPLRPNIPAKEPPLEEEILSRPKVSQVAEKAQEGTTPKASKGTTEKTPPPVSSLEEQLAKSLENPKAKPPVPKETPGEKKDYTQTDKYAKDKAAKNEKVVSFLKGKGVSKQAWREASLDQKNKWIRDATGTKHREYQEGTTKAETRTKEIEDLLPDIDATQRFGEAETPEVRKFLGHPEPKPESMPQKPISEDTRKAILGYRGTGVLPKGEPLSAPKVSPKAGGLERPPGWEKGPADQYFKFDISRRAGEEPYVRWDESVPLPERLSEAQIAKAQQIIADMNKRTPGGFQGIQDRLDGVKYAQGRFGTPEERKRTIHELLHSVNPQLSKQILEAK